MFTHLRSFYSFVKQPKFCMKSKFKNCFQFSSKKPSPKQKYKNERISSQDKKRAKDFQNWQVGMYGLVVALSFAALPLYRVFCQHVGLVGNTDQKTYEFQNLKQVPNLRKYTVKFQGHPEPGIDWEFQPIQKEVIVSPAETAIVFYKLRNKQKRPIVGFSTYNIYPQQVNLYFSKIQCFCFNQQMINPDQELLLPLFFYLQPELNDDPDVGRINEVRVNYQFYQSVNQDLAKFAQEQLDRIQQNKRKLNQIRAKKKNMSLQQYQQLLQKKQYQEQLEVANLPIQRSDPPLKKINNRKKQQKQVIKKENIGQAK